MTTTPEAYVHLSEDQKTLTFYYDTLRAHRDGTTWGIRDAKDYHGSPAWTANWVSHTTVLTAVFDASFRDFRPTTTAQWFKDFQSLNSIEGFEHLNTSQVTDMRAMFFGCKSLRMLNLSSFNTAKVREMFGMFKGCYSLTALDLSNFDTSKVTDMYGMFFGCYSLTALDLSNFDTSKVEVMYEMFAGCYSLTALDLSSFDTSKVTDMRGMFAGCQSLTVIDLSKFRKYLVEEYEGNVRGLPTFD